MGEFKEAERMFRKAIVIDPKFAEYHQDLASFLSDMGRFEEAAVEAERTVALDPSMPEAHRLFRLILMRMGDPRRARDEVELLLTQARTELYPSTDVQAVLNDLHACFPDDELIDEALRLNADAG